MKTPAIRLPFEIPIRAVSLRAHELMGQMEVLRARSEAAEGMITHLHLKRCKLGEELAIELAKENSK